MSTWLSPAFPTGAFAYSHGLEAAIAEGWVTNAETMRDWVAALLLYGSLYNDLVLGAEAFRAVGAGDLERLTSVAELATALCGTSERRLEVLGIGAAFLAAAGPWLEPAPTSWPAEMPYAVGVGAVAARSGLGLETTLAVLAGALAHGLVSAATRLVPLGQRDAVTALRDLEPVAFEAARQAAESDLSALGSATLLSEIAAMRHETLKTRLFRS